MMMMTTLEQITRRRQQRVNDEDNDCDDGDEDDTHTHQHTDTRTHTHTHTHTQRTHGHNTKQLSEAMMNCRSMFIDQPIQQNLSPSPPTACKTQCSIHAKRSPHSYDAKNPYARNTHCRNCDRNLQKSDLHTLQHTVMTPTPAVTNMIHHHSPPRSKGVEGK